MPLDYGQRAHAGFDWEDRIAKKLERKGAEVSQPDSRRHRYDLEVNGYEVDVKAAIETEYEMPNGYPVKGYVFTNLKTDPDLDYYILVCLDDERNEINEVYVIPSKRVPQRTVTITGKSKYRQYEDAWDRLMRDQTAKTASSMTVKCANLTVYRNDNRGEGMGHDRSGPRPRDERHDRKTPLDRKREKMYKMLGTLAGGVAGAGIGATVTAGRNLPNNNDNEMLQDVDFGAIVGATSGGIVGNKIGEIFSRRR